MAQKADHNILFMKEASVISSHEYPNLDFLEAVLYFLINQPREYIERRFLSSLYAGITGYKIDLE